MHKEPYKFTVGDVECMVIADGTAPLTLERCLNFFSAFPADEVEQAFNDYRDSGGVMDWSYNILYMKIGAQHILIDAGFGVTADVNYGHLRENLQSVGIKPTDIHTIIISHWHGDHYMGLTDPEGKRLFPKAVYFMVKEEQDYWRNPETLAKIGEERAAGSLLRFTAIEDDLKPISMDAELAMYVRTEPLPGHSPAHIGILVESNGETLFHMVDTAHTPFQCQHPDWSLAVDYDPAQGIETRWRAFEKAADENLLVMGYHFPFPGVGHIERQGQTFIWKPL